MLTLSLIFLLIKIVIEIINNTNQAVRVYKEIIQVNVTSMKRDKIASKRYNIIKRLHYLLKDNVSGNVVLINKLKLRRNKNLLS